MKELRELSTHDMNILYDYLYKKKKTISEGELRSMLKGRGILV